MLKSCKSCNSNEVTVVGCKVYGFWCECLNCGRSTPVVWDPNKAVEDWQNDVIAAQESSADDILFRFCTTLYPDSGSLHSAFEGVVETECFC